ncbi:hypothetical protein BT69DRAFT_1212661 [Atractiella rhizophila]|nr:hypothetical protein BT69DRAFT_1212661 [Atractiella rhizophila]
MDEKGLQLGGGRKIGVRHVIGRAERRAIYQAKSDKLELVTLIECATMNDQRREILSVLFNLQTCSFTYTIDLHIALSENGWTDEVLGYVWFISIYVPYVQKRPDPTCPALLIVDGHGSHASTLIICYVWDNLHYIIHIICLPPHTMHKLQPLDVGVFGPVGKAWS